MQGPLWAFLVITRIENPTLLQPAAYAPGLARLGASPGCSVAARDLYRRSTSSRQRWAWARHSVARCAGCTARVPPGGAVAGGGHRLALRQPSGQAAAP